MDEEEKKGLAVAESLAESMSLADVFVKSGIFPDIKTQAQAVVKMIAGKELGLSPIESMSNIFFVKDKRGLTSGIQASLLKQSGKYDYVVDKLDETECILSFYKVEGGEKDNTLVGKSSFGTKDAAKAGLINKDNYKNYPRNCFFARALSNGIRWYCPEIICSYALEELEDLKEPTKPDVITIDNEGEVKKNGEE